MVAKNRKSIIVKLGAHMKKLVVMTTVRVFRIGYGNTLGRTGKYIEAGTEIEVEAEVMKEYDHEKKTAIPFMQDGQQYFLLEEELDPVAHEQEIRERMDRVLEHTKSTFKPH